MGMQSIVLVPGMLYQFMPEPEEIGLGSSDFTDIRVDVQVITESRSCVLLLEASAKANLVCDRTLDPFTKWVSGVCRILAGRELADGPVPPHDEMIILEPAQRKIDVTRAVRDTLVLAIPVRKVAPDAEDKVLQCVFGAPEENADSCWSSLRQLQEDFL